MDDMQILESVKQVTDEYVFPNFIKPCVALMIRNSFEKGQGLRDRVAYIIATECRRIHETEEKAEKTLRKWDEKNISPLGYGIIRNKIRSAYGRNYEFGCKKEPIILEFCQLINKDFCPYNEEIKRKNRKHNVWDFFRKGWQRILNHHEVAGYLGLIGWEKILGVYPGFHFIAGHRKINYFTGISLQSVGKIYSSLKNCGLVEYVPGQPYRWRKEASIIRRILPIPESQKLKYEYQK